MVQRTFVISVFFQRYGVKTSTSDKPFPKVGSRSVLKLANLKQNQQFPELGAQFLIVFSIHQKANKIWSVVFRERGLKKSGQLRWTSWAVPKNMGVKQGLWNHHSCFLLCFKALACPQGQGLIQRYNCIWCLKWKCLGSRFLCSLGRSFCKCWLDLPVLVVVGQGGATAGPSTLCFGGSSCADPRGNVCWWFPVRVKWFSGEIMVQSGLYTSITLDMC